MHRICFSFGETDFSTSNYAVAELELPTLECRPVTVLFRHRGQVIDTAWLEKEKARMLESDDVFNDNFLDYIIFCEVSAPKGAPVESPATELLDEQSSTSWTAPSLNDVPLEPGSYQICSRFSLTMKDRPLRSGPYFIQGRTLYTVYRLFEDPFMGFMFGVSEDGANPPKFHEQRGGLIPVPSRLYFGPPSERSPLSGKPETFEPSQDRQLRLQP